MAPSFTRFIVVLSALSAAASIFVAQPAGADETEGAQLFREGRALMLEGRFAEACPKLEESQRIEPRGGTLLNVAACHERIGHIATAWAEFHDALGAARAERKPARAKLAEERIAALDPRLPWITILVAPEADAQGVRVTLDGAEIARATWGKEMPIDPGDHLFVVSATGRVEHRSTIAAREGLKQVLEVKGLAEIPAPPPPEPPPAEPPPAEPSPSVEPPPPAEPPTRASRFGRWVFEAGLFGAYMNGSMDPPLPSGGEDGVQVSNNTADGPENSTCHQVGCSYSLGSRGSFVGGVSLFAGYAARSFLDVGGRVIMGPRLHGGMLFATGPSVSLNVAGPLWIGASAFIGYASQSEKNGEITVPPPYYLISQSTALTGSTDFAGGAGIELRVDLVRAPSGALSIGAQPLFLAGSRGSTFVLPFALSYRFR